jgi:plasmid stabilization system protein ParE
VEVVLHTGAVADLTAAGDWYETRRPGLGSDFAVEVERALAVIGENPTAWSGWPDASEELQIRRFLLSRFPFALAYTLETDRVIVLAVAHVKRRPGYWLSRAGRSR